MKRHIQKLVSFILILTIICGLGPTAFAAAFADVSPSSWYAQAVELSLIHI